MSDSAGVPTLGDIVTNAHTLLANAIGVRDSIDPSLHLHDLLDSVVTNLVSAVDDLALLENILNPDNFLG